MENIASTKSRGRGRAVIKRHPQNRPGIPLNKPETVEPAPSGNGHISYASKLSQPNGARVISYASKLTQANGSNLNIAAAPFTPSVTLTRSMKQLNITDNKHYEKSTEHVNGSVELSQMNDRYQNSNLPSSTKETSVNINPVLPTSPSNIKSGIKSVTQILTSPRTKPRDDGANGKRASKPPKSKNNKSPSDDDFIYCKTKPDDVAVKQGKTGRTVQLQANYFRLETHTTWCLFQYRVDFEPEEDRTNIRKDLLRIHKLTLGGHIFDGTMLFTSHRLNPDPLILFSARQSDKTNIKIHIRLVGDLAAGDYHYIQLFNILMRQSLTALKLQLVGRNFFDPSCKTEVPQHKLELWPGYVTSIRQHEYSIMMCCEVTHKVMRQETVLDLLIETSRRCQTRLKNGEDNLDFKKVFKNAIMSAVVLTDYNNRTYRIDDVDFSVNPLSTFNLKSGEKISYSQYYRNKYDLILHNNDQPMLVSRAKPRERRAGLAELVYLPPELCRMTGLTDQMRMNFQLMKSLADHTRIGPNDRVDKLLKFNRQLNDSESIRDNLQQWNIRLAKSLVEFSGRELTPERVYMFNRHEIAPAQPCDWTRELKNMPMLHSARISKWAIIFPNSYKRDTFNFVGSLLKSAASMKFNIPDPNIRKEIPNDLAATYSTTIDSVLSQIVPNFVVLVVPNARADRYSAIKKKCCVDRSVASQVILAKNLQSKNIMSIATKVAIQLNCKIGGTPWSIEIPIQDLMVVGFDVCHDTNQRGRSCGALVASLDRQCTRYFSAVSHHTTGEELSNDLALNMARAIRKYEEINHTMPGRVIIYRDGVGEGQIPYVFEHEVELLKNKLKEFYGGKELFKMAFIIVTKRINTRIFKGRTNPVPGTVVDDVITMPERYDFFLVSQSVRHGTVSPTSYNVIFDNTGLNPDRIQRLTYKLTHLYYNWSGTVRVPAPVQYAHKLAYLSGQALHHMPSNSLEDYLHFL